MHPHSLQYQVDQKARDGDEALHLCKLNHPDLAFVDLHMPKIEGLEVLADIRGLSPNTDLVVITVYGSSANAVLAMKLGALAFLEKPIDHRNSSAGNSFPGKGGNSGIF